MNGPVLIGLDSGTSMVKAAAFEADGAQIASASRRNTYSTLPNGGVEQDMRRTWADAAGVLSDLLAENPNIAKRAAGLGVTGQGDGCWLADVDGEPVHDGWLWLDARAAAEARALNAKPEAQFIYERCGAGINVCQMRTHLTWMKAHAPELLRRAASAFHPKDWLYFQFTGERAADPTEGVFTFGDFRTRAYSDEVIDALGLADVRHLLPPILDGARETRPLCGAAAQATGLPAGLPVALGYVDIMCTGFGGGLYDAETAPGFTILGSTGVHMRFVPDAESVRLNPARSGYVMAFPGRAKAQMQTNMAGTLNIDWMLDLAREILDAQGDGAPERESLLDGLDDRILAARPGAALYHPYISAAGERGPFIEPDARASFTGLSESVGWFDLMRAVFEGLAFAARDCYAVMGEMPPEIRLAGGGARSAAMRSILAAVLGVPVRTVNQPEAGAAGAAMTAALAVGLADGPEEISDSWIQDRLGPLQAPDAGLGAVYKNLFPVFQNTHQALNPVWGALADVRRDM